MIHSYISSRFDVLAWWQCLECPFGVSFPINHKFCFSNPPKTPKTRFHAPIFFQILGYFTWSILVSFSISCDFFFVWITCSSCFVRFISSFRFCTLLPISYNYHHNHFMKTLGSFSGHTFLCSRFVNGFFPDINARMDCSSLWNISWSFVQVCITELKMVISSHNNFLSCKASIM